MIDMRDCRWLFFDIGSTLVDETEAYDHRIRDMIVGTGLTFAEVDKKRMELARQGLDGNTAVITHFGLKKTAWHSEDEKLYPEAKGLLERLKGRGYKLGVLANQVAGISDRLQSWGIGEYFDVIASSAELGVAKPDAAIFERALEMAGCTAGQAVMIGDRLDNDILPAKGLGMMTIWIRNGMAAVQEKKWSEGIADLVVDSLAELERRLEYGF